MRRLGATGLVLASLALASLTLAACELGGLNGAAGACVEAARDYSGTVAASFTTTVGAIRRLEPHAMDPQRWPDLMADHVAVLCYIDATIEKGPPPGLNGQIQDPFDRVVVAVVDGNAEMIMAGYHDRLPVRAP